LRACGKVDYRIRLKSATACIAGEFSFQVISL
jgi:hypothetical protein